jgi:undecaprenyl-diphosphatase
MTLPGVTGSSARVGDRPPNRARSLPLSLLRTVVIGYVVIGAVILGLGLLVTATLEGSSLSADDTISRWLVRNREPVGEALSGTLSELGNTTVIVCGMLGFCVAALAARWWQPAFVVAGGLTIELSVFLTVNYWLDRPRPDLPVLGSVPSTASFPSGHAAAAVVFYLGLALAATCRIERAGLRRLVWGVACVVGFSVGIARAYRGVHHPSDVVAGWALGIACLLVTAAAVSRASEPCAVPDSPSPSSLVS